ncbi:ATP-binding cassette sub-family C member 5-like [Babylonia areolata]|uniref:ATP-binding cassette sub-family C member 5-like n=1 Tax=Babylonia areolata TaxID=304850 RepID=UPI003FCFC6D5
MDPMEGEIRGHRKRGSRGRNAAGSPPSSSPSSFFRSISQAFSHNGPRDLGEGEITISKASVVSLALYSWLTPVVWKLCRVGVGSILNLTWMEEDTTAHNVQRLERAWNEEVKTRGPAKAQLGRAIRSAYHRRLVCSVIVILSSLSLSFVSSAFLLRFLLKNVEDGNSPLWKNVLSVCLLVVCEVLRCLTYSLAWCFTYWTAMRVRQGAMGLLFKKMLRLRSLKDKKIGELVNMCSNDGQRLYEVLANAPFILGGPFIFLAGSIYLVFLIGPWAFVAIGTFLAFFIMMKFVASGLEHYRQEAVTLTGQRVGLMTEVLTCMKLIKMNAWEPSFIHRISKKRQQEQTALEKASFLQSIIQSLVPMVPIIASVLTFIAYILNGNDLSVAEAFTVITVLYSVSFAVATMIHGIRTLADARVATVRYQVEPTDEDSVIAGITAEDFDPLNSSFSKRLGSSAASDFKLLAEEETAHNSSRLTEKRESQVDLLEPSQDLQSVPQLCSVNLSVSKGELIGICGMKGSGKSALLAAIMGRMQLLNGDIKLSGRIAYAGQEPWIINGTARENIVFGLPYDKEKFDRVVSACSLDKDFETFGAGELVEIGDRGLTLSGGQKQRISLARAMYSDSDIYLLDDPLSALDIQIGRHVFTQCLKILLKSKTVLFVTHHLEYLPKCDRVILMHEGSVVEMGPHSELLGTGSGPMYTELYQLYQSKYDKIQRHRLLSSLGAAPEGEGVRRCKSAVSARRSLLQLPCVVLRPQHQASSFSLLGGPDHRRIKVPQRGFSRLSMHQLSRHLSRMSTKSGFQHQFSVMSTTSGIFGDYEYVDLEDLVESQDVVETRVSWSVYGEYIRAMGGYAIVAFLLVSFAISIAVQSASTWFLSFWLNQGNGSQPGSGQLWSNPMTNTSTTPDRGRLVDNPYLHTFALVYGLFVVAMVLIMIFRSLVFVKILLRASSNLHRRLLKRTMTCPMKFFDITPLGIILNRFSADIDEIDVRLPSNLELYLQNIFLVLCALAMVCYAFPWDLLVVFPLAVVFVVLAMVFAPVLQQLKFVDSVTRSPYLSHLASSMEGLDTLHTFGQSKRFFQQFCEMLDRNSVPFFLFYMSNRWLAILLDLMIVLVIGVTGFLTIFTLTADQSPQAGLALSFAIQVTSLLQYTLRLTIETGSRFSSVQRVQDYIENLQREGAIASSGSEVPSDWPSQGSITFSKYCMRYNDSLPPAIKNVSLTIKPKEKIGIVGNSGSGKSSLGVGLFRLSEAASGAIYIDDMNIRDIKLSALRTRISILVQDPVLFEGTIRYNLDPPGAYKTDTDLWQVLGKCHMKEKVQALDKQLDTMVEENGKNFSMGERQLLCLARTLLRKCKILVLDEATASVDTRTDFLVQQTLRECCRDNTVLTIAHRINTIWDCDKVLVMDRGRAVEYNHPLALLQKPTSRFKAMYDTMKAKPRGDSICEEDLPPILDAAESDGVFSQ